MTVIDEEMPDYLRRFPLDAGKEAAAAAAWNARAAFLREQRNNQQTLARGDEDMVSLWMLHCKGNEIPRLGPGDHQVKALTIGEKFVRIDLGSRVGPVMLKKQGWDSIEKEKIMEVVNNIGTETAAAPPVKEKKPRRIVTEAKAPEEKKAATPKAKAPAAKAKKGNGKAAAAKTEGRDEFGSLLTSHRAQLFKLLVKNEGKPVKYAAACKAVYGNPDVPAISGVIGGCKIQAAKVGVSVTIDGKGKDQTITLRRGK